MLSQDFYIIIDRCISAPKYSRYVVGGLNYTEKRYIFRLMYNVQLPGQKVYDTFMVMH